MIVNELNGNIDAEGIVWKNGTVNFDIANYTKKTAQSIVLLKNIKGETQTSISRKVI